MTKNTGIGYKKGVEEGRAHVAIPENAPWIKRSSLTGRFVSKKYTKAPSEKSGSSSSVTPGKNTRAK